MKRIIAFVMALFCVGALLVAIEQVKLKRVLEDPYSYKKEAIWVEGFVTSINEDKTLFSKSYFIQDDWGTPIMVVTVQEYPDVGKRFHVEGMVNIGDSNDVYLTETTRYCLDCKEVVVKTSKNKLLYILIAAAALLLFIVIVLAIVMSKRQKRNDYLTPVPGITSELAGLPEPSVVEGSTIKMSAPPPGTLKLLPGRLEVYSGDSTIKEIRFYKTKAQEESEITFGRAAGPAYTHILLKPPTVSTKHAKLIYTNNRYTLINYAKTNPTIYNGTPMEFEASVTIDEGDRIEMGEVVFIFHEK